MKRAIAYQRRRQIILHSSCRTEAGVWIPNLPVVVVGQEDKPRLGDAVLVALEGSKENVPHPTSWDGLFDPVLEAAGVRSWASFAKSAKSLEVEFGTNRISLLPTRNLGPTGGFELIPGKARTSSPVAEELGAALLCAFEESE